MYQPFPSLAFFVWIKPVSFHHYWMHIRYFVFLFVNWLWMQQAFILTLCAICGKTAPLVTDVSGHLQYVRKHQCTHVQRFKLVKALQSLSNCVLIQMLLLKLNLVRSWLQHGKPCTGNTWRSNAHSLDTVTRQQRHGRLLPSKRH